MDWLEYLKKQTSALFKQLWYFLRTRAQFGIAEWHVRRAQSQYMWLFLGHSTDKEEGPTTM